jgi:hypothetical protein
LLLISLALFGLASLASAFSPSVGFLAGTRFFTGAGIAGGFAGSVALTGDYTPHRLRAMMIMLTFTGAPLGGFVGGLIVSSLLAQGFGWPIIYIIGGGFPLVLIPIAALWLPESPRLLAAKSNLAPRHRALLRRLDIAHTAGDAHGLDIAQGNPIRMLFGEGYALQTTLLWIIFFCSLLNLFLFIFWLPEVLHAGSGGICDEPLSARRHFRGALPRMGDRPLRRAAVAGGALCRGYCVHRANIACGDALFRAACCRPTGRGDGARQPDRVEWGLRQALSGPHAHQRLRVCDRRRTVGRHRRGTARRVSAGEGPPSDLRLSVRLRVCGSSRHRDCVFGVAWQAADPHHGDGSGVVDGFVFDLLATDTKLD